jgi:hypothetical protein
VPARILWAGSGCSQSVMWTSFARGPRAMIPGGCSTWAVPWNQGHGLEAGSSP